MQLETRNIETGMVHLLADLMYNRLSHDENGRTNVIKAYPSDNSNDKGLKPNQPFMTVHVMSNLAPYGWLLDQYVDANDRPCYVVAFQIPVMLTCYGKGSHSIITELKQRLEFASTRDEIERLTGTRLLNSGDLPNNYDYLNTDFENCTPLIISLVCNSTLVDTTGGIIEHVIADGQLNYKYDEVPPEIEMHFDVKSTDK